MTGIRQFTFRKIYAILISYLYDIRFNGTIVYHAAADSTMPQTEGFMDERSLAQKSGGGTPPGNRTSRPPILRRRRSRRYPTTNMTSFFTSLSHWKKNIRSSPARTPQRGASEAPRSINSRRSCITVRMGSLSDVFFLMRKSRISYRKPVSVSDIPRCIPSSRKSTDFPFPSNIMRGSLSQAPRAATALQEKT